MGGLPKGYDALKASGADAVYYGTQMRGVSNAKAKRELNFQPRPLEWIVVLENSQISDLHGSEILG
jgi:hypothetical protein